LLFFQQQQSSFLLGMLFLQVFVEITQLQVPRLLILFSNIFELIDFLFELFDHLMCYMLCWVIFSNVALFWLFYLILNFLQLILLYNIALVIFPQHSLQLYYLLIQIFSFFLYVLQLLFGISYFLLDLLLSSHYF